jgi:hypothetical protein
LSQNMLANPKACKPLTQATLGVCLALAATGAIGLGCGIAGATPQPPLLVDDALPTPAPVVPTPAPVGPNPASPVNIANAIFTELNNLLSSVFPGSSSVFMPADAGTSSLSPELGYPGAASSGYPPPIMPGSAAAAPGSTGPVTPGQAPLSPAQPDPVSPVGNVPVV